MAQMVWVKRGRGFYPADPLSAEYASGIPEGKQVLADVTRPRSPKQNRFVHALLHEIVKHTDEFFDVDDIKRHLKVRTRMFTTVVLPDGRIVLELEKTDFGSMDQIAFQRVWRRWAWVIKNEIVPGLDEEALRERILEQIA
jgi:hypothetical protein